MNFYILGFSDLFVFDLLDVVIDLEKLDDAGSELMMVPSSGKIMLFIGEAFIEATEDQATECKL